MATSPAARSVLLTRTLAEILIHLAPGPTCKINDVPALRCTPISQEEAHTRQAEMDPHQMEISTHKVEMNPCQAKMYPPRDVGEMGPQQMENYTSEAETTLWRLFALGA